MISSRRKALTTIVRGAAVLSVTPGSLAFTKIQDQMYQRIIPSTGEKLPVLGMGTWQTFDVSPSEETLKPLAEVLSIFYKMGGRVIDSSPMYGNSEKVTGILGSRAGLIDSIFMATKVWTNGEQQGIAQMKKSAQLLQKPKIDLMQVHNLVDYKTHYRTLTKWKKEGKIRYIGITHYTSGMFDELQAIIKQDTLDFVQFNYSIEDTAAEKSLLPLARDKGVATIINRPFESGGLFSKTRVKALPDFAASLDIKSWGQYFLKFIISHPGVTCAIPATSKPNHMTDNMGAGFGKIPDEQQRKEMLRYYSSL